MEHNTISDHIDTAVTELVAVFHEELAEQRFPHVDASTLAAAVELVNAAAEEAERQRLAHQAAMESLRAHQQSLRDHARLAHAYARVFATGNADLTARLDGIVLDEPVTAAPPRKRRTRRSKTSASAAPQLALARAVSGDGATAAVTAATDDTTQEAALSGTN